MLRCQQVATTTVRSGKKDRTDTWDVCVLEYAYLWQQEAAANSRARFQDVTAQSLFSPTADKRARCLTERQCTPAHCSLCLGCFERS